jgi:hypothetical protein
MRELREDERVIYEMIVDHNPYKMWCSVRIGPERKPRIFRTEEELEAWYNTPQRLEDTIKDNLETTTEVMRFEYNYKLIKWMNDHNRIMAEHHNRMLRSFHEYGMLFYPNHYCSRIVHIAQPLFDFHDIFCNFP